MLKLVAVRVSRLQGRVGKHSKQLLKAVREAPHAEGRVPDLAHRTCLGTGWTTRWTARARLAAP